MAGRRDPGALVPSLPFEDTGHFPCLLGAFLKEVPWQLEECQAFHDASLATGGSPCHHCSMESGSYESYDSIDVDL